MCEIPVMSIARVEKDEKSKLDRFTLHCKDFRIIQFSVDKPSSWSVCIERVQ